MTVTMLLWPWGPGCEDGNGADIRDSEPPRDAATGADVLSDSGQTDGAAATCESSGDCTLISANCCSACGKPTASDVQAVTSAQARDRRNACEAELCPSCPSQLNPYLQAVCAQDACSVFDGEGDPSRDCDVDADCEVRSPDCCGCGSFADPYALIAIHGGSHDDYVAVRCPEIETISCEPCDPSFPGDVTAACDQGKCVTVLPPP